MDGAVERSANLSPDKDLQGGAGENASLSGKENSASSPHRRRLIEGCAFCRQHGGFQMMPWHDASSRCESGKHPHCTCDTCF